jgi:RNA polymerase sigma factor (sigma-70 family)
MAATEIHALQDWIARRDADAFKTITNRYSHMVYGTCCRILGDSTEAEDVTQECFEALAGAEPAPWDYVGPWLHRVATNLCRKRIRSDQRRRDRETRFAAQQHDHTELKWDDIYGFVDEAIQELPEKLRVPLGAHYLEDASHASIARTLGIPRRTVSNRLAKALQLLGKSLKKRGVTAPATALASLLGAKLAEAAPVPTTLKASLGKLALTLTAPPISPNPQPTTTLQGVLAMKTPLIGIASAVVLVSTALVLLFANAQGTDKKFVPSRNTNVGEESPDLPSPLDEEARATEQDGSVVAEKPPEQEEEAGQPPLDSDALMAYIFDQQDLHRVALQSYAFEAAYKKIIHFRPSESMLKNIKEGRPGPLGYPGSNGIWSFTDTGSLQCVRNGSNVYATRSSKERDSVGYVVANEEYVASFGINGQTPFGTRAFLVDLPAIYYHRGLEKRQPSAQTRVHKMTLGFDRLALMYSFHEPLSPGTNMGALRDFIARIPFTEKEARMDGELCHIKLCGPAPDTKLLLTIDTGKAFAITGIQYESENEGSYFMERILVLREVQKDVWFPCEITYEKNGDFYPDRWAPSTSDGFPKAKFKVRLKNISINKVYPARQFSTRSLPDMAQNIEFSVRNADGTSEFGFLVGETFVTKKSGDAYRALQGLDVDRTGKELAETIKMKSGGSAKLEKKLHSEMTLEFEDITLDRVLGIVGDMNDLDFRVDEEAVPTPADAKIRRLGLDRVTVHEILEVILTPLGLDYNYVEDGDYLLITTTTTP